jgi:phosphoglycerate dehydrogenase-like enzyme
MRNTASLLLWTDAAQTYIDAIAAAGLSERVSVSTLGRGGKPSAEQLAQTEVLLVPGVPPGTLPAMPKLRWAQSMTAGVESWLALPDLPDGLTLTCARGTHKESMPENILAAMFYVGKPFAQIAEYQQRSHWGRVVAQPLNGRTLGILGLGAIGQEVARLATALGMRVIGTKRRPHPMPGLAEVLPPERTDEVLHEADFLLLLLPATPWTENYMNAERLGKMKPGAWLLNFGRGHTIDDAALIAAVTSGGIAGAVLDVFRQEPLPASDPYWTTPGILVLPHIGGPHPTRDVFVARLFVENLRHYLDGTPLTQVVDRAAGY